VVVGTAGVVAAGVAPKEKPEVEEADAAKVKLKPVEEGVGAGDVAAVAPNENAGVVVARGAGVVIGAKEKVPADGRGVNENELAGVAAVVVLGAASVAAAVVVAGAGTAAGVGALVVTAVVVAGVTIGVAVVVVDGGVAATGAGAGANPNDFFAVSGFGGTYCNI
jgi:hypothetical protein